MSKISHTISYGMQNISDLRKWLVQYETLKNSEKYNYRNQSEILEKKYSKRFHEHKISTVL